MCKNKPLPRCTAHIAQALEVSQKRYLKKQEEYFEYIKTYDDSLHAETPTNRDLIRQNKADRLLAETEADRAAWVDAQADYDGTPLGQEQLEGLIDEAKENGNDRLASQLEQRRDLAAEARRSSREEAKELHALEKVLPPEEMEQEIINRVENLSAEEAEVDLQIADTGKALEDAETALLETESIEEWAEREGFDPNSEYLDTETPLPQPGDVEAYQAYKAFLAENEISAEELTAARLADRKRRMQIALIGSLAASVLTFVLIKSAISKQRSRIMAYGSQFARSQTRSLMGGAGGTRKMLASLNPGETKALREKQEKIHTAAIEAATKARDAALEAHNDQNPTGTTETPHDTPEGASESVSPTTDTAVMPVAEPVTRTEESPVMTKQVVAHPEPIVVPQEGDAAAEPAPPVEKPQPIIVAAPAMKWKTPPTPPEVKLFKWKTPGDVQAAVAEASAKVLKPAPKDEN